MPKDRITQLHQGYGFVEFLREEDADYAIKVMNMIKVYGKPVRVNKVCCDQCCLPKKCKYKTLLLGITIQEPYQIFLSKWYQYILFG